MSVTATNVQINHLTDAQRKAIAEIAEFQETTGLSDTQFVRQGQFTVSASTWSRLKSDQYKGNTAAAVSSVLRSAQLFRDAWQVSQQRNRDRRFYEFGDFKAVFAAVQTAQSRALHGEEDKLVIYCAPSGWGKTHLATELALRNNARVVTARQSWKGSYFSACANIATAVGVTKEFIGAPDAELALLTHLTNHPGLIVLNEVEYFSKGCLNLLKTILNETACSIVMLCIPEFFSNIRSSGGLHSSQLIRRAVGVIHASKITSAQASKFMAEHWKVDDNIRAGAIRLAAAANRDPSGQPGYGFKLIARVTESLANDFPDSTPTVEDVETAINVYHQALAL